MVKFLSSSCLSSLCMFTLCSASFPDQVESESCEEVPNHSRFGIRYTTPKGIGYNQGYTTLEGFFAPQGFFKDSWLPFLDLRGHILDNGKFAANAGGGIRYLSSSRIWGGNAYYDYRNTTHQHYNQVSAGLETLGTIWDFRINGYLPIGWKNSPFRTSDVPYFKEHYMLLKRTREFALKGANAEIGAHIDHFRKAPVYLAAGPYYLTGTGKTTWGGEFRATVDLFDQYLKLGANTSYDHFFKWIGQGQISLNIPLGAKNKVRHKVNQSCSQTVSLNLRAVQSVDRNEIIPVGKQHVLEPAMNPVTQDPYYFVFVDNTSSSFGTYESPFPSLSQAEAFSSPGDIIYVFAGNGTSDGMNEGIILKDSQMLLGGADSYLFPTTLGFISIPPMSSSKPIITNNTLDSPVVTLANHNTVSGFYIENKYGSGILGTRITDFTGSNNTIRGGDHGGGIILTDVSGKVSIRDSQLYQTDQISSENYAIEVVLNNDLTCSLDCIGNKIESQSLYDHQVSGVVILASAGELSEINLINNEMIGNSLGSIIFGVVGGSIGTLNISESAFSNNANFGAVVGFLETGSIETWNISNCAFNGGDHQNGGVILYMASNPSIGSINLTGSTFSGNVGSEISSGGFAAFVLGGSIDSVRVSKSSFENNNIEGSCASLFFLLQQGVLNDLTIVDSSFKNNGGADIVTFVSERSPFISTASLNQVNITNSYFSGNSTYGNILLDYVRSSQTSFFANIEGNQFVQNSMPSIIIESSILANSSIQINENTFTDNSSSDVNIQINNGTACLEFKNNQATPTSNAYYFTGGGSGVLNRTVGSDETTNIGEFSIGSGVGDPGSCFQ